MNWKKQFKDLWESLYTYDRDIVVGSPYLRCEGKVKAFIQRTLDQQREEMVKRVKGMKISKKDYECDCGSESCADYVWSARYNQAIDDILSALKGKE
jgi:hypothetical protein